MTIEAAVRYLEQNRSKFLDDLKELVSIPSISGVKAHEKDLRLCAELLVQKLKESGIEKAELITPHLSSSPLRGEETELPLPMGERAKGEGGRSLCGQGEEDHHAVPLVCGEWAKKPGKPTLLIYGHYDVVGAGDRAPWKTDPFCAEVKDERIYGRGTDDDKGQLLTALKAAECFLKGCGDLPLNVKFLFEGEEETSSETLEKALSDETFVQKLSCDAVLSSDGGWFAPDLPTICFGTRGIVEFEVVLFGPKAELHSGVHGGAVGNPINLLTEMLASLRDEKGRIAIPGFYDGVVSISAEEREAVGRLPFDEKRYREEIGVAALDGEKGYAPLERTLCRPALDIVGIWGGYAGEGTKSAIPTGAGAKVGIRIVADQDPKKIERLVREHLERIRPKAVRMEMKFFCGGSPWRMLADESIISPIRRAFRECFGKDPLPVRVGGSIPILPVLQGKLRKPIVMCDIGLPDSHCHSSNENFPLSQFYGGIEMYIRIFQYVADTLFPSSFPSPHRGEGQGEGEITRRRAMADEKKKILIVDDDPDLLISWRSTLAMLGEPPPLTARSGDELRAGDFDGSQIRLAIVDFTFEGSDMDGSDVVRFLKEKGVEKVYLSTGYAGDGEVCRKAREAGAAGILPKPVDIERLREIL